MATAPQSAQTKSGETISIACNLPHGLIIRHKGKEVRLNGANHPKAISTDTTLSGTWGLTHNVDKAWLDDWVKEQQHPAVANGNIMPAAANVVADMATEFADQIPTGTDPLNQAKPAPGITPVEEDEG